MTLVSEQPAPKNAPGPRGARRGIPWRDAAAGLLLGLLLWTGAFRLGLTALTPVRSSHLILACGLMGALLGMTRGRIVLWMAAAAVGGALLIVMYTPLAQTVAPGIVRRDPLQRVEAVVVLASDLFPDGTLTDQSQARLLHGYTLIQQGYARRLVVTRHAPPKPSYLPTIREQMRQLRMSFPVEEVGPIVHTQDEATATARLARERGWRQVLLVSNPLHMRRAAATFEKAGLPVVCSPCPEGKYYLKSLRAPDDRLRAFQDWMYEMIGYQVYRRRGWI